MEFVEEETYATATQVDAPWHLDILDQESIMFNGQYSPIGDGDGVDIYILDTGTSLGPRLSNLTERSLVTHTTSACARHCK